MIDVYVALPSELVIAGGLEAAEAIPKAASLIEELGAKGCFTTDHPVPDARWLDAGGHHGIDPTVALSFAAAATKQLRLLTNIFVLSYRNPLMSAKSLVSLEVLSGGRLTIGVGAGYLRTEFSAVGADFTNLNQTLDDSISVLKSAWTGEPFAGSGDGWRSRGAVIKPVPTQKPHPPIWCGGNSRAAVRRVVDHADGWLPFQASSELSSATKTSALATMKALETQLEYMDSYMAEVGRSTRPRVCFTPRLTTVEQLKQDCSALESLGVSAITVTPEATNFVRWTEHCTEIVGSIAAL